MTKTEQAKWIMPREHGVWAMLLVPFLLGAALGGFRWLHLLAGIGFLLGYVAMNAVLEAIRHPRVKPAAQYTAVRIGGASALLLAVPFVTRPQAFWPLGLTALLFLASLWFVRTKRERHFVNDLLGITALTMMLPVSAGIGGGAAADDLLFGMAANVLYFTGSVFFVKGVFRERNNRPFHLAGAAYHLLLLALPFLLSLPPVLSLWYLPGAVKMVPVLAGKSFPPKTVGIIEIANACWFAGLGMWVVG